MFGGMTGGGEGLGVSAEGARRISGGDGANGCSVPDSPR